jgi:hypothetical protein
LRRTGPWRPLDRLMIRSWGDENRNYIKMMCTK